MNPAEQGLALQTAVYGQLVAAMAGEGVSGADVPVFDHIPINPPKYQLRIDEFSYRPGGVKRRNRWEHRFAVHVFARDVEGRAEAVRLHGLILDALAEWAPIPGATALDLRSGDSAPNDTANAVHEIIRFQTIITGEN